MEDKKDRAEKIEEALCEMISAAGAARSCYISAIAAAKNKEADPDALREEGNALFQKAHEYHHELLAMAADGEEGLPVTMLLVHVEDQLMCAETFRILADEFIGLYKRLD